MTVMMTGCPSLILAESARRWLPQLPTAAAQRPVYLIRSRDHPKALHLPMLRHALAPRLHLSWSPRPNPSRATRCKRPTSAALQVPSGAPLATNSRLPDAKENNNQSQGGPGQSSE